MTLVFIYKHVTNGTNNLVACFFVKGKDSIFKVLP